MNVHAVRTWIAGSSQVYSNFDHFQHHSSTLLAGSLVDLRIVRSTPFGPFPVAMMAAVAYTKKQYYRWVGQDSSVVLQLTICYPYIYLSIYLFFPVGILWWLVSTSSPPQRQSWSIHSSFWVCTSAYDTRGRSWDRCWTMLRGHMGQAHNCRHWRT